MSSDNSQIEFKSPSSFKGKYVGVFLLAIFQVFVGAIHVVFGVFLSAGSSGLGVYGVYTFLYGIIAASSAYGLYTGKFWGWTGTITISIIVTIVDVFTVLDLPIISGVPKFAAIGEIPYSLAVIAYLIQPKIITFYVQKRG